MICIDLHLTWWFYVWSLTELRRQHLFVGSHFYFWRWPRALWRRPWYTTASAGLWCHEVFLTALHSHFHQQRKSDVKIKPPRFPRCEKWWETALDINAQIFPHSLLFSPSPPSLLLPAARGPQWETSISLSDSESSQSTDCSLTTEFRNETKKI